MITPFSDGVAASLAPWNDEAGQFEAFNRALGSMFDQVTLIVQDVGSPDVAATFTACWSTLLDPDACPDQFLPFLALFVGVSIPQGASAAAARAMIYARSGWSRGTPAAIVAAAQQYLSGSQSCVIEERTAVNGSEDAYHFCLIVLTSQVTNAENLTAAVNLVRPAGVEWTLIQVAAWTIGEMEAAYATIALLEAAFATVGGLESDETGH